MSCKHQPQLDFIEKDLSRSEIGVVKCMFCDESLIVRLKNDYSKPRIVSNFTGLPKINLRFDYSKEDHLTCKENSKFIDTERKELSLDRKMEVLYEMLADDEIDMDQFNKYSAKMI